MKVKILEVGSQFRQKEVRFLDNKGMSFASAYFPIDEKVEILDAKNLVAIGNLYIEKDFVEMREV